MADEKIQTILFQAPQFRGKKPNTVSMSAIHNYIAERREEQREDNSKARGKEVHYAIGVDYVFARKIIARLFKLHMVPVTTPLQGGRGAKWKLDNWANNQASILLLLGVRRITITRWLSKYEDFNERFVITNS